jgi:hypothetical protein
MIQYFPRESLQGWWDIAHNGKRVGYIIKRGHFYELTLNVADMILESWTTMEAVKLVVENALEDKEEPVGTVEEWAEEIE